jgi:pimeloyl-ACP methyl ester carboxylesterase
MTSLTPEQYRSTQPVPPATIPIPPRQPQTGAPFDRLPPALYQTRLAIDRKLIASMPPTVGAEIVTEYGVADHAMLSRLSAARKANPALLGDMPVIVLSRGRDAAAEQHAAHDEISRLSRNSRHVVVPDSYHEIHLSHPDVVAQAVGDVVAAVRNRRALR